MQQPPESRANLLKILPSVLFLLVFLVSIDSMSRALGLLGDGHMAGLFSGLGSPMAALAIGILATAFVQSSSVTTSLVVTAVSSGQMQLDMAAFAIMGCNIGTTITSTLVALGHIRQEGEFRRAFSGSLMHDVFNILAVAIFMPLELTFGILGRAAESVSHGLYGDAIGGRFTSPVKLAVNSVSEPFEDLLVSGLELDATIAGMALLIVALIGLFFSLSAFTRTMRGLLGGRLEESMNRILTRSGLLAIAVGAALTAWLQSSSITTSLMVPLFAAGILKLENGFPVTLGANAGTTATALLASLAADVNGLTIALVHMFLNVGAILIIYPIPALRRLPIMIAVKLTDVAMKKRALALLWIILVFFAFPLLTSFIFQ